MRVNTGLPVLLAALVGGCYVGYRGDDPGLGSETEGPGGDGGEGEGGDTSSDDDPEPDDAPDAACGEDFELGHTPLRRLTRTEYDNIARDLLGDDSAPAAAFVPDEAIGGFDFNTGAPLTAKQAEEYFDAAEELSAGFVADRLDAWIGCARTDDACADGFIRDFGLRAFRRPLADDEVQGYLALYVDARDGWGADAGFEAIVHAMLTSPFFLYHFEPRVTDEPVELDPYQLAARLSFFVWGSLPDDDLFDAAAGGGLVDTAAVEAQVRRMLEDPRAGDAIASFHAQWLGVRDLDRLVRDPDVYPEWNAELGASMTREIDAFTRWAVLEGDGTLATLLTAPVGFVDDGLADIYGVQAPATPLTPTDLPADERAGLLTTAAFLTATSHAEDPSVVFRGKFVRERLLCGEIPFPDDSVFDDTPMSADRLENGVCAGCHNLMDRIGFGFAQYDAIGAFDADADAKGEVVGVGELGEFEGAVDLAGRLAAFDEIGECVVQEWYRYANRRAVDKADSCQIEALRERFVESGGNVRELIVDIATSTAFRHRAPEE